MLISKVSPARSPMNELPDNNRDETLRLLLNLDHRYPAAEDDLPPGPAHVGDTEVVGFSARSTSSHQLLEVRVTDRQAHDLTA